MLGSNEKFFYYKVILDPLSVTWVGILRPKKYWHFHSLIAFLASITLARKVCERWMAIVLEKSDLGRQKFFYLQGDSRSSIGHLSGESIFSFQNIKLE